MEIDDSFVSTAVEALVILCKNNTSADVLYNPTDQSIISNLVSSILDSSISSRDLIQNKPCNLWQALIQIGTKIFNSNKKDINENDYKEINELLNFSSYSTLILRFISSLLISFDYFLSSNTMCMTELLLDFELVFLPYSTSTSTSTTPNSPSSSPSKNSKSILNRSNLVSNLLKSYRSFDYFTYTNIFLNRINNRNFELSYSKVIKHYEVLANNNNSNNNNSNNNSGYNGKNSKLDSDEEDSNETSHVTFIDNSSHHFVGLSSYLNETDSEGEDTNKKNSNIHKKEKVNDIKYPSESESEVDSNSDSTLEEESLEDSFPTDSFPSLLPPTIAPLNPFGKDNLYSSSSSPNSNQLKNTTNNEKQENIKTFSNYYDTWSIVNDEDEDSPVELDDEYKQNQRNLYNNSINKKATRISKKGKKKNKKNKNKDVVNNNLTQDYISHNDNFNSSSDIFFTNDSFSTSSSSIHPPNTINYDPSIPPPPSSLPPASPMISHKTLFDTNLTRPKTSSGLSQRINNNNNNNDNIIQSKNLMLNDISTDSSFNFSILNNNNTTSSPSTLSIPSVLKNSFQLNDSTPSLKKKSVSFSDFNDIKAISPNQSPNQSPLSSPNASPVKENIVSKKSIISITPKSKLDSPDNSIEFVKKNTLQLSDEEDEVVINSNIRYDSWASNSNPTSSTTRISSARPSSASTDPWVSGSNKSNHFHIPSPAPEIKKVNEKESSLKNQDSSVDFEYSLNDSNLNTPNNLSLKSSSISKDTNKDNSVEESSQNSSFGYTEKILSPSFAKENIKPHINMDARMSPLKNTSVNYSPSKSETNYDSLKSSKLDSPSRLGSPTRFESPSRDSPIKFNSPNKYKYGTSPSKAPKYLSDPVKAAYVKNLMKKRSNKENKNENEKDKELTMEPLPFSIQRSKPGSRLSNSIEVVGLENLKELTDNDNNYKEPHFIQDTKPNPPRVQSNFVLNPDSSTTKSNPLDKPSLNTIAPHYNTASIISNKNRLSTTISNTSSISSHSNHSKYPSLQSAHYPTSSNPLSLLNNDKKIIIPDEKPSQPIIIGENKLQHPSLPTDTKSFTVTSDSDKMIPKEEDSTTFFHKLPYNFRFPRASNIAHELGIIFESTVTKRSQRLGIYQPRYMILQESETMFAELRVYDKCSSSLWGSVPIGLKNIIAIPDIITVKYTDSKEDNEFIVIYNTISEKNKNTQENKILHFRTETTQLRMLWLTIINQVLELYRKQEE